MPDLAEDARYMRRALALAKRGRTHPNPMVGAVVVKDGVIVGEGWHKGVGTPHAEAMAFAKAGDKARGATIYVTLEPCSFYVTPDGKPRMPCSQRCLDAGVARVVGAMTDPDPRVSDTGYAQLRAAGVDVQVGVEEEASRALNHAYIRHRTTNLPYIIHKAAMTLDGKIAAAETGDSRWVTGETARKYVHRLRDRIDALVVGIGTVLKDDPSLTTRLPAGNGHDPLRVILDSSLRLPETAKAARVGTLVYTTERAPEDRRRIIETIGIEVVTAPQTETGQVDVEWVARDLASRGKLAVLLESGGTLAAAFWEKWLVNKVIYFVAPKIIGGAEAATPLDGAGLARFMADARTLGTLTVRRFGPDVALEAEVQEKNVYRNH
jgi:diaminohydroxyphosphoribosylaminopyrimidine deaminase/5-amino-6-(5-phosphoribosylamino)uracil reductase